MPQAGSVRIFPPPFGEDTINRWNGFYSYG